MASAPSGPIDPAHGETRFKGLLCRGGGWRLTRRGWAVLLLCLLGCTAVFLRTIHPFLAVHDPVEADVLVVEGWVSDYALKAAAEESRRGDYPVVYVTGGPMERGAPLSEYGTYAALGAAVVVYFGVPTNQVQSVPAPRVRRDRTYASALALRDWFVQQGPPPAALNIVTIGPHARRSRLLYEKAFGKECRIGLINVADEDYDARRWWAYSHGVRSVMSETVSYLYARLFFRMSADQRAEKENGEDPGESSP